MKRVSKVKVVREQWVSVVSLVVFILIQKTILSGRRLLRKFNTLKTIESVPQMHVVKAQRYREKRSMIDG